MGRDKDGSSNRKAGGRTAASSSAAAAMVAAMGAGGGLTFAAFDPHASAQELELDPDMALALKKLSKKDSTTKIKALGELLGFFDQAGGRSEEELALILPLWQQPFETVAMDADRRVREALFVALGALVVRVKRHMTKYVKGLMLPWLCARFDTEAPVRAAANSAFSALFPPAKIADALLFCKNDIQLGLDTNISHSVQTLCDPKLFSKEEAEDTLARVQASSLLVLAHVLEALPKDQAVKFSEGLEALHKPVFWKLVTNSSVHVRAAFYTAIRALTVQAPSLLRDAPDSAGASKLRLAGAAVVQGLSDKEAAAHSQMWECILVFFRAFPEALAALDLNKAVLPRLFTFVKCGAYGSSVDSFPCLVPFTDLCLRAAPHVADKMHMGLLQGLWEALAGFKSARGSDEGARAATVRAYFECLLHGWQQCAAGDVGDVVVADRVLALSRDGLLPCVDVLLRPPRRGDACAKWEGEGTDHGLLTATVKCIELLCCRDELAVARPSALKALVARLQCCPASISNALGDQGEVAAAEEARALSAFVCALKSDGKERDRIAPIVCAVCTALRPKCWDPAGSAGVRRPLLAVLCDVLVKWGGEVLSEDTAEQGPEAGAALLHESVLPLIATILDAADAGGEEVLGEEERKTLDLLFQMGSTLLLEQDADSQGEVQLWIEMLTVVAGGTVLPKSCARIEALHLLVEHAASAARATAGARRDGAGFVCRVLDAFVEEATARLLLRGEGATEPGMLAGKRLLSLTVAVFPGGRKGGGRLWFLVSEGALAGIIKRLARVMQAWAGLADGEPVEEGMAVAAAMSSAGTACIETVERVLLASQDGLLSAGCLAYLLPILGALFQLRMHSEDMLGGGVGGDMTRRPRYDHGVQQAGRLRSTIGFRAYSLWEARARAVLVEMLQREDAAGPKWLEARARETSALVCAASSIPEAMVLGDQAAEMVAVARLCGYEESAVLPAMLSACAAIPQGASTREEGGARGRAGAMWLACGLRLMHCLGVETVVRLVRGQLEAQAQETAMDGECGGMEWLLEEVVLAYSGHTSLPSAPGLFARRSNCRPRGHVWSHAAVCGAEGGRVLSRRPSQEEEEGTGKSVVADLLQDVALAWRSLVVPCLEAQQSWLAEYLAKRSARKTLEGCLQWPRALGHIMALLAKNGGRGYVSLCSDLLSEFRGDGDSALQSRGSNSPSGTARLAVVLAKVAAEIVARSEDEVQRVAVGETLLYTNSVTGMSEEV